MIKYTLSWNGGWAIDWSVQEKHHTWGERSGSAGVAEGCRHGLVAQAELRAVVKVRSGHQSSPSLSVTSAPVVPASQMFCHQGLLHVFGQELVSGPLSAPRWSHCGVRILRKTIRPITAVMPEPVMSMVAINLVGWVHIVVAFNFILIHVGTISIRLHVRTGVAGDIVGTGRIVCWGLAWIITTRMVLDQVGHASSITVHFHFPVKTMHGWGTRVQCIVVGISCPTVVQTGLAGVGGAVF